MLDEVLEKELSMEILDEQKHDLKDGVFCGIRHREDPRKYLVVKHKYGNRRWSLPGGGIRQAEIPPHAGIRESLEEANVRVTKIRPVGQPFSLRKKYGLVLIMAALEWDGIALVGPDNPEIEDVRFVTVDEARVLYELGRDGKETEEEKGMEPAQYSILLILNSYWNEPNALIWGHLTVPPTILTI